MLPTSEDEVPNGMLQPSQLDEVSARFPDEIAEVRAFLSTSGTTVETPGALAETAQRVRQDRSFHRDLSSHVWVLVHRHGAALSYSDLLGILAVAAAGTRFASDAAERDAHELLRFLMEARDAMAGPSPVSPASAPRPAVVSPVAPASPLAASVAAFPLGTAEPSPISLVDEDVPAMEAPIHLPRLGEAPANERREGRPLLAWAAAMAVCIVAVLAAWWLHRGSAAPSTPVSAPIVNGGAPPSVSVAAIPPAPVPEARPVAVLPRTDLPSRRPLAMPRQPPSRTAQPRRAETQPPPSHTAAAAPARLPVSSPPPPGPRNLSPASESIANTAHAAAPIVRSTASSFHSASPPVPATVLAKRLGTPSISKDEEAEYDSSGRRYPHLLRRQHAPGQSADADALVARNEPAGVPGGVGRDVPPGAAPSGIVRPTSLGVMASNLLYSPAAAYPSAASTAHVQGAVKLQAVVDPAGNVAAARVISGPPLLRDAALNAVRQWRYRPYTTGGKARSFTTEALMEFELP